MRIILLSLMLLITSPLYADQIRIPRGSINVNQLHDDILEAQPVLRGDTRLYVQSTEGEIIIDYPDTVTELQLRNVISSYTSKESKEKKRERSRKAGIDKLKVLGLDAEEANALFE